jgi:hypothetical protein
MGLKFRRLRARNDRRPESRCNGELAILAFIQGQVQDARRLMASAIMQAHVQHDTGAEIRFISASGTALALVRSFRRRRGNCRR